jgi:hypothetical protein
MSGRELLDPTTYQGHHHHHHIVIPAAKAFYESSTTSYYGVSLHPQMKTPAYETSAV